MDSDEWYLMKADDQSIFGPTSFYQLRDWAMSAKISPFDKASSDGKKTWVRAPMVTELHMDWLVEVSSDFLYGPTTIGTIQEFLASGEITPNTTLINCVEGTRTLVKDNAVLAATKPSQPQSQSVEDIDLPEIVEPTKGGISRTMQDRVLHLEGIILDLRRKLEQAENRHQRLRARFMDETHLKE